MQSWHFHLSVVLEQTPITNFDFIWGHVSRKYVILNVTWHVFGCNILKFCSDFCNISYALCLLYTLSTVSWLFPVLHSAPQCCSHYMTETASLNIRSCLTELMCEMHLHAMANHLSCTTADRLLSCGIFCDDWTIFFIVVEIISQLLPEDSLYHYNDLNCEWCEWKCKMLPFRKNFELWWILV